MENKGEKGRDPIQKHKRLRFDVSSAYNKTMKMNNADALQCKITLSSLLQTYIDQTKQTSRNQITPCL